MNELQVINNIKIEDMIYEVRGKQVMLDSDVAKIYHVETKRINEVVKRNLNRFPEEFCFQLTKEELDNLFLKSQIVTSNNSTSYKGLYSSRSQIATLNRKSGRGYNIKYHPYVFTEHGVMMLSGLLKSEIAAKTNVAIINAFVKMKTYISSNLLEQRFINNMVLEHDNDIKLLKESFSKFDSISNEIFYEGQIYDAYSLLLDILNSSKESIIIIDNFANKKLFDILSKTDKKVTVYSKNIDDELINKYKKQYNNVTLIHNDSYHDRFIIIDNKILYHCGSSFKDLGTKCFCISKIENQDLIRDMLSSIKSK